MKTAFHPDPGHKPKNWSLYFLEFLLITLAVALGFFAESIRERLGDQEKEREFIISMMEDAILDTAHIHACIELNRKRMLALDSVAVLLSSYTPSAGIDAEIYRLYRKGLSHPDFVSPTERTMTQLKNAGGMRLIRQKAAVEAIVQYDDMAKNLVDQQAYYERYQNSSIEMAVQLLDFQVYKLRVSTTPAQTPGDLYASARLLNNNRVKLIEFGNRISVYQAVVRFYIVRLEEMNQHARNLIATLKKEYELGID